MQRRNFETYQKCFKDFEILPKFSETHVFRGTIRHPSQSQAIFVAATRCNFCRVQGCNFKIALVNQVRLLVRFIAAISRGFRTCLKLDAILARQKLHRVAATKIACVNGP